MSDKQTNQQTDLANQWITKQAAIDALGEKPLVWDDLSDFDLGKAAQWSDDVDAIKELPSAQPQRSKGRWEIIEDWDGDDLYRCSECGSMFTLIDGTPEDNDYNFCPSCGADMRTKETDYDYERAVEQLEYDMLYEPTFNQDDGSM